MALSGRMASPLDYSTTTSAGVDYGRRRLRLLKGAVTRFKVHRSSLAASPTGRWVEEYRIGTLLRRTDIVDGRSLSFRIPAPSPGCCCTSQRHSPLARMKLHAGSQSGDERYRQNHSGDHPSPVAFNLRHLQFAVGNERAAEQRPHPRQPGFPAK